MQRLYELAGRVAQSHISVLVRGETGVELIEEVVFAGDWSGWGAGA